MFLCTKWMWFFKFREYLLMWLRKLYWYFDLRRTLIASSIIIIAILAILPIFTLKSFKYVPCRVHPSAHDPTRFSQDNSGQPPFYGETIPNLIHFYRTGSDLASLSFIDALCLYSAFRFSNPDEIMIHTDDVLAVTNSFSSSAYGKRLMEVPGFKRVLNIHYWPYPKHVFGIEFNSIYKSNHVRDVTKLRILRKYGGILLDNHAVLLKNPYQLRFYEMVVFGNKGSLTNNLIMAHRDARMLDLWLKSYHRYDFNIPIHHHTPFVKNLFIQKSTFYHKFENGVQEVNAKLLNSKDGLEIILDTDDCYMLYLNSSQSLETGSENNDLQFKSDSIIDFVERYVNSVK